jgi:hypothetical protein
MLLERRAQDVTTNLKKNLAKKFRVLVKCLYFADTIERGDRGVKGGPKTG